MRMKFVARYDFDKNQASGSELSADSSRSGVTLPASYNCPQLAVRCVGLTTKRCPRSMLRLTTKSIVPHQTCPQSHDANNRKRGTAINKCHVTYNIRFPPGYGKFNFLLLLAVLPASFASIFSSSAISYVLPSAECDLGLSMFDKGLLNSMTFAGCIHTLAIT